MCVSLHVGPSPDAMQVYTWSELKELLCFFAKCILNETIGAEDSPLHEFQHRLLPHIESLLEIKVQDCTYERLAYFLIRELAYSLYVGMTPASLNVKTRKNIKMLKDIGMTVPKGRETSAVLYAVGQGMNSSFHAKPQMHILFS